jgi:hypothetical protein
LVKTLLLAQLAPRVRELRELTATRVSALNHGSIKALLPNQEVKQVIGRLRELAGQTGVIHLGEQSDPSVRAVLDDVSVLPLIETAKGTVTPGVEQRVLKGVLFQAMRLDASSDANVIEHQLREGGTGHWRGSQRRGQVRFGNVRRMPDESLQPANGVDYLLVIDYPFDDVGFGPHDDEAKVDRLRNSGEAAWTLVWLPSFLSTGARSTLRELAAVGEVLARPEAYLNTLGADERERARATLQTMLSQKRTLLTEALEQAYGLRHDRPELIDPDLSIETHLQLLQPDTPLRAAPPANLADAADTYAAALLETRYPRHPVLKDVPTPKRREQAVELFGRLIDEPQHRLVLDRDQLKLASNLLQPMGLVRLAEDALLLDEAPVLRVLEAARERAGDEQPSVAKLGRWLDPEDRMGLSAELRTLYVRCYARWSARTLVLDGMPLTQPPPVLGAEVELRRPDLPEVQPWNVALERAGQLMGISFAGRALHADNLARLDQALNAYWTPGRVQASIELPGLLQRCLTNWEIGEQGRLRTAQVAKQLAEALAAARGKARVLALAQAQLGDVSPQALSAHLAAAESLLPKLKQSLELGVLETLRRQAPELGEAAQSILSQWCAVLRVEEVTQALAPKLDQLARQAQHLHRQDPDQLLARIQATQGPAREVLNRLVSEIEAVLAKYPGNDVQLSGELRIKRG